jgi:hypothetical protein
MSDIVANILVAADPKTAPLRPFINGVVLEIPFNVAVPVTQFTLDALGNTDIAFQTFEIVSQATVVAETSAETNGGGAAGGTGASVVPNTSEGNGEDTSLKLLDGNVASVIAALPGLPVETLNALLAAEESGKTRATAISAIQAAITALTPAP